MLFKNSNGTQVSAHDVEKLEARMVLDGEWSALEGASVSASLADGQYISVTTIDLERNPIVFEQADRVGDGGGSDFWEQMGLLTTDDGMSNGVNADTLGRHSLAVHDHRLIIGAPNFNFGAGAAATFELNDRGEWVFRSLLTVPGLEAGDGFGWSVDMHGNTAVIGTRSGDMAYVFEDRGGWEMEATLEPMLDAEGGRFGFSVAVHGSVIAVGAPGEEGLDEDTSATSGAVYIFERSGNDWDLAARLDAPESAVDSEFGFSVDAHASTVLVGAWLDDDMGADSGSVFGIGRHGREWLIESKVTPQQESVGARFGYQVSTGGSRAVVIAAGSGDGAVFSWAEVLKRRGDDWSSEGMLPYSSDADPLFRSVEFVGERVALGSEADGGTVVVFRLGPPSTETWELEAVRDRGGEAGEMSVGFDVAMHGDTLVLGGLLAPGIDDTSDPVPVDAAAWVFRAPDGDGMPDTDTKWVVRSLGDLPGVNGDPVSNILTWTDVKDGQTYAAVATTEGLMLFTRSADRETWTVRNLTAEIDGAELITSDIEVFGERGNRVLIVGYNAEGELVMYRQPNTGDPGDWDWVFHNISERDLRPQGIDTPQFVGAISGYATRWNALNITGLDAQGRIRAVWIAPGMERWKAHNLSANAGTPELTGSLAAFTTSWGAMNLAGVDAEGRLVVTWWVPGFSRWVISDFNSLFGGAPLEPDSVTAYTTAWGALNIVGRDDRGDVITYWWVPQFADGSSDDRWRVSNISTMVGDGDPPSNVLEALITPSGQINLFGTNRVNDVIRYYWERGDHWRMENLTHTAETF